MKKKVFSWMLVLILVLSMALSVSAAEGFVYDEAGLLTASQRSSLERTLANLSNTYDAQIIVATIPSSEGVDVDMLVEYIYDGAEFGYGPERDGVLLLICMDPRAYRILSNGYCGIAIDHRAIDAIGDAIVDDLSSGYYADAFRTFADKCGDYLEGYINGYPFDFGMNLLIALAVGFLVGTITALYLKSQLKTVRRQERANSYVKSGSMNIRTHRDVFLYRDVRRTRKQNQDSGRSGGRSSSGSRSVGGGSF